METTILILLMTFSKISGEHFTKQLNHCRDQYVSSPRNEENRNKTNCNITWDVIVSEPQCTSLLSISILQVSIYTNNERCTDYLKIEDIHSSRVLFHSCRGKKNHIETTGHGVKITFISCNVHEVNRFTLSFKKKCSRNIPICITELSSLKPTTLPKRESILTKKSQERISTGALSTGVFYTRALSTGVLSRGVLPTEYLTETSISAVHRSTVAVAFKDTTDLTVVVSTSVIVGFIVTSVAVLIVIFIIRHRNHKKKTANRSIQIRRTSLHETTEDLYERNRSEITMMGESCIGVAPGSKSKATNTGQSQMSECGVQITNNSLALSENRLRSNNSRSTLQYDDESNPYLDNSCYDILFRPRSRLYETQRNIYDIRL